LIGVGIKEVDSDEKPDTLLMIDTPPSYWLGWAYLAKKMPHAATTPIATAFKIWISHQKNGLLNGLPKKISM
jgi:hypothetical protein